MAQEAFDGKSLADVAAWFEDWQVVPLSGVRRFYCTHPVEAAQSFTFIFNESQVQNNWPTERALVVKLLSKCLPGPDDCTAEPGGVGELTLTCGEVAGASLYRWYGKAGAEWAEIAESPTPGVLATGLDAGSYQVKAAGVAADGTVGLLSKAVTAEVG